jgi:tRNA/tmRNA/rRNA uracil-C5-methylase (TrmA/RlmC/RlmD family)
VKRARGERRRAAPGGAGSDLAAPGGELVELTASGVAHGGWCVARDPGGRVVFLRHALPGERVRARITAVSARFARADAVEVLAASPDRVRPACPHARPGGCGGCDWQHASPAAQRALKAEVVRVQLRRIAGIERQVSVEELPGTPDGLGWRTRVRFSVGPDGTAGLLGHRSHEVVPVADCPIAHPLVRAAEITTARWEGHACVEVAVSPASGERAVFAPRPGGRVTPLSGPAHVRYTAAGRTWRAGAGTFWQVHPAAADVLAAAVTGALEPTAGDSVLDLYCGAGLFAGVLAAEVGPGGAVTAVDSDRRAVRDARHNLRRYPWARVHAGDVAAVLAAGGGPAPGLAVLDPPRAGAARAVIEHLIASPGLRRVAYVSCDPATLARDVAVFAAAGWRLAALRAFDAFPMTHHIECVAALAPGPP